MRFAGDIFFQKGSKPANRKGGVLGYKNQQEETTFSTPTFSTPTSTTPTSTTPTSTAPTSTTPTSTTPTSTTPTSTTPTFSSPASARVNPNIDYADLPIFKAISPNTGNIPSFTNDANLPSLATTQDKPKDSDNANGQPTPFGNYVPEVADETDNLPEEKTSSLPQLIRMERYYNPTSASHFFTADPSKEDLTGFTKENEESGFDLFSDSNLVKEAADVYRLYSPTGRNHLYTISEEEKESAIRGGYSLEGVVGEAYTKETEGAIPIQRFYNPQSGKHLLTKDKKEIETLANLGYMPENIAFYTPSQKNIQNYMDAVGKLNVLK